MFFDHFWYHLGTLLGLWWNSENWAIAWEGAQSRGLERVTNQINFNVFSRHAPEPPYRCARTAFLSAWGPKVSKSDAQWVPKSIKNRPKVVSGIHLVSPWLPDPPQGGPRCSKRYQKWSKIDDFGVVIVAVSGLLCLCCGFPSIQDFHTFLYPFIACEFSVSVPCPFTSQESGG